MTLNPKHQSGLKAADAKFLANIEEHGWVVTLVTPRVGEEGGCFAYSTGLFRKFGQPEIVMFGLPLERMHKIINNVGYQMKGGIKFVPDKNYSEIFANCSCQFKSVDKSQYREHLGWSIWFYEGIDFPTLQCYWPDKNDHFPWQPQCIAAVIELQPFLHLPAPNSASQLQ